MALKCHDYNRRMCMRLCAYHTVLGYVWILSILLLCAETVADKGDAGPSSPLSTPVATKASTELIEMKVLGFRLWMIIGFVLIGLLIVIIALCCIFDCRIPRTKQEIEADIERRREAKAGFVKAAKRIQRAQKTMRAAKIASFARGMSVPEPPGAASLPDPPSRDLAEVTMTTDGASSRDADPQPDYGTQDFQMYEKPQNYGKRIVYKTDSDGETSTNGSRQFRPPGGASAQALASIPRQSNSRV